jgi:hypothetical protein
MSRRRAPGARCICWAASRSRSPAVSLRCSGPMRHTPLGLLWTAVAPAFDAAFASTSALPTSELDERRGKVSVLCRLPDDWRAPALPAAPRITVAPLERVVDTLQPSSTGSARRRAVSARSCNRALQRLARDAGLLDVATIHSRRALYAVELAELGVPRNDRRGRGACHGGALAYVDGRARPLAVCSLSSGRRRGARAHRAGGCRNRPRCCRSNLRRRARHSLDHRLQDQRARGRRPRAVSRFRAGSLRTAAQSLRGADPVVRPGAGPSWTLLPVAVGVA